MDLSLFDYNLPVERIAQRPAARRDASKLLVLHRDSGLTEHRLFPDIVAYLRPGDLLVMNDSRVIHARLYGARETGGKVELFLIKKVASGGGEHHGHNIWETLAKPAKRLRPGEVINIADGFSARIISKTDGGSVIADFECKGDFDAVIAEVGKLPLPPYIRREADAEDEERYQTVYSREPGSVAAPTAGLHFTDEVLGRVREAGAQTCFVTLHVGAGTFKPVQSDSIEEHRMHSEDYSISEETAGLINSAKAEGRRVICVGTTSVRTVESAARANGVAGGFDPGSARSGNQLIMPGFGSTDIYIYPGFEFRVTDALITNFHLPKSTLLMLVSAFADREMILAAYDEAIKNEYRFFSYGDAMVIL